MLVEMSLKTFFRNHIYSDVFKNLTFQNLPTTVVFYICMVAECLCIFIVFCVGGSKGRAVL